MGSPSRLSTWGKWVAGPRTKWITLVLWIVVVAILSVVAPSVNKEENNNAATLPSNSPSLQAQAKIEAAFPSGAGTPALVVWYRPSGLTSSDVDNVQKVSQYLNNHPVGEQTSVVPLFQLPVQAIQGMESNDKTTLVLPVSFNNGAAATTLQTSLKQLQSDVTTVIGLNPFQDSSLKTDTLHARVTGPVGIATDALGLFKNADFALLAATTVLVLVLLILLYRSPVLAFVPLIGVGFAYGVISPVLGALAKSGIITVDAQGVSIMTVLLFGAGTDYCLFLVARYRERLFHVDNRHQAIREAVSGASGAIAMSGLTVVLSLLTLLFARYGSDHRFAIPFSLAILVMAFAGVTLVPALLAILGRGSFFPFIPRTTTMWEAYAAKRSARGRRVRKRKTGEPGRFSLWIGRIVSTRPWTVAIVSVVGLAVLALFSMQITTTYNLLSSFPSDMPSRQGFTILADHFSPGTLAPVDVLVENPGSTDKTKMDNVKSHLEKLSFVKSVTDPVQSTVMPSYSRLEVTLSEDPYSQSAMNQISTIRSTVEQELSAAGVTSPAQHVWIGGETATELDTQNLTQHDTSVVIPIVICIIAILLLLYLRSVVATVYLIATVLLSYFSALGIGWIVLHDIMGASAIEGAIPLYSFVFLVALGEDYNIFMVSRIWQERHRLSLREAIAHGVSRTSGVITSAGLILAGTFAVLASLPLQVLVQFGIVTAIGVLLDTFIVRPFVVPSITAILGRAAFWPSKSQAVTPSNAQG